MQEDVIIGYLTAYVQDNGIEQRDTIAVLRRPFITYLTEILELMADDFALYDITEFNAEGRERIQEIMDMYMHACQYKDFYIMVYDPGTDEYVLDE